jgi:uncharacterized protein DUF2357/PD-(D/E)XK nuclease superfamily protein
MSATERVRLFARVSRSTREEIASDVRQLQGERTYFVEGPESSLQAIVDAYPDRCLRLRHDLLQLEFGNAVGFIELPDLGRFEVISGKWGHQDFDKMLVDLMQIAAALPFSAALPAALPYERSVTAEKRVLYHEFVYLRYILSESAPRGQQLIPALGIVLREPHRQFLQMRRDVSPATVQRIDARTLHGIAVGRRRLTVIKESTSDLVRRLGGRLPEAVDEGFTEVTHDTPENRFVKRFVHGMQNGIIDAMRSAVAAGGVPKAFARRTLNECDRMEQRLRPWLRHAFWTRIGRMTYIPVASTVLQRRRGYREIFRHFARLRLAARVPLPTQAVTDFLEIRDIAQLYELWCYFAVVRELKALRGYPSRAARPTVGTMRIVVPWEFEVAWPDGLRVLYNPYFSRTRDAHHSYSLGLRPDIALEIPRGANQGVHLLDAKFKLDRIEPLIENGLEAEASQVENEDRDERRGSSTRGDLYKMHTYRDAIQGAHSVWILYPGTEISFFDARGGRYGGTDESLPECIEGVGAVPFRPDRREHMELRRVLTRLLAC